MMADTWPDVATSPTLQSRVNDARILVVGSGGIGCELLKTLVLTGFYKLDLIDMDTIETSNLNRQFLFRKHHVGHSKSEVAAEAVKKFCPRAQIKAHRANIKDAAFDVPFIKGFDLIMNGLDNLNARRHVNRLALAADVPLIESGTTGYTGQVTVHVKSKTRCYECVDKAPQKGYPICTIRNTPDKPIHCIVWAKELLFTRLFGKNDQLTDLDDRGEGNDEERSDEGNRGAESSCFTKRNDENYAEYSRRVFDKVFNEDISRLRKIEDLWTSRTPPDPLNLPSILPSRCAPEENHEAAVASENMASQDNDAAKTINGKTSTGGRSNMGTGAKSSHHKVWSLEENTSVFLRSIETFLSARSEDIGAMEFDKDDDLAVEFVTSAANLRGLCYGIPAQTLFDAKGMAGNIIHAIATTNAIVAGLMVIEGLKVLSGKLDELRETFIGEAVSTKHGGSLGPPKRELLLKSGKAEEPRKDCVVCGTSKLVLEINTMKTSLKEMVDKVLKAHLSINAPIIICEGVFYEEGEGLEEDVLEENLAMLPYPMDNVPGGGLKDGFVMEIQDQTQNFKVNIVISHKEEIDEEIHPKGFILEGEIPEAEPEMPRAVGNTNDQELLDLAGSDDDILYMSEEEAGIDGLKRKREDQENDMFAQVSDSEEGEVRRLRQANDTPKRRKLASKV